MKIDYCTLIVVKLSTKKKERKKERKINVKSIETVERKKEVSTRVFEHLIYVYIGIKYRKRSGAKDIRIGVNNVVVVIIFFKLTFASHRLALLMNCRRYRYGLTMHTNTFHSFCLAFLSLKKMYTK